MKILVFDTETTGLPSSSLPLDLQPKIIQFAGVLYEVNDEKLMQEIKRVDVLIDPKIDIPVETTMIHKITNEMVKGKPIFSKVFSEIRQLFIETDMVCAHNIAFDKKLLQIECERLEESFDFWPEKHYDTMLETIDLCRLPSKNRSFKSPRLSELHEFLFDIDFDNAHNALFDVLATGKCLQELINRGYANISPSNQVSLF
jgi:DNA polymerase III epsilon subunit-like protein